MHPILLDIESLVLFGHEFGPIEIHSYGILIAFGYILATYVGIRWGKQDKIRPDQVLDLAFWALLSGLIGARIFYMVVNARNYWAACFDPEAPNPLNNGLPFGEPHCYELLRVWEGGLVFYGGLLGAIAGSLLFLHIKGINKAKAADLALGAVPLGHFFGRLGCLAAGCCFGRATNSALGIRFPEDGLPYMSLLVEKGHLAQAVPFPVHPTQLYEALGELTIFIVLFVMRRYRRFYGQIALSFLVLYPLMRSLVELFRGDAARGLLLSWETSVKIDGYTYSQDIGISIAQLVSLAVATTAAILLIRNYRQANRSEA